MLVFSHTIFITYRDALLSEKNQFRDPYDWVQSMYERPYNMPLHKNASDWKKFVSTPWTMARPKEDALLEAHGGRVCQNRFRYHEVVPCTKPLNPSEDPTVRQPPKYELRLDGSGMPYNSIVDLRRDKILNFLNTGKFDHVTAVLPVRYEDLLHDGTRRLLTAIEGMTGVKAKCEINEPRKRREKVLDSDFVTWMNNRVDWSTEAILGYQKR